MRTSILLSLVLVGLVSCVKNNNDDNYDSVKPKGPKPSWGATITPQMQTVIEALDTLAPVPIFTLTPEEARMQPSAADAVKRVMTNYGIATPAMLVDTIGKDIPVVDGTIHLRIYTPKTNQASYPVVVYFHGGGWVIATVDTYNSSAQALAEKTDAVVVSVEYRKGPEFKFPTAHNDAFAAYKWVLNNASTIKGDSSKVALAGESAGGNLAVGVAIMARDSGVALPKHIVSVYPVANKDASTASKLQYTDAEPLATPALPWFLGHFLSTPTDIANPLISLVDANLADLPATTIIAAEIDPLFTEGKQLADKLQAAGVTTDYQLYAGVTHEFFGMATVVPEAKSAQDFAASQLQDALK